MSSVLSYLKDGTHGTHKDVAEGVFLLSAKNIKNGKINYDNSDRIISISDYNQIHSNFKLQKGDVLLTIVGTIGETAIITETSDFTFQRSVAYLRPNSLVKSKFLLQLISTGNIKKQLESKKTISAQPGIYLGELANIFIIISNIYEQEKIENCLAEVDNLITLHQRKYNNVVKENKNYDQFN